MRNHGLFLLLAIFTFPIIDEKPIRREKEMEAYLVYLTEYEDGHEEKYVKGAFPTLDSAMHYIDGYKFDDEYEQIDVMRLRNNYTCVAYNDIQTKSTSLTVGLKPVLIDDIV